jgi:acyl-coenzyme A synthetase/AMP-(fatty) acid ligase
MLSVPASQDMIAYQGKMVAPAELESILVQFPGIVDAAVLGVSDGGDGLVPRALVVLGPGVEGTEGFAQKVQEFVSGRVEDHKKLRGGVGFVQEIPRLVVGKMCRDKLPQLVEQ